MAKKRIKTDAFSIVLRKIRLGKNLSQEELAIRLNVSRSYISYLESGRRYPSIEMLIALAKALEIKPGTLIDSIAEHLDSGRAKPLQKQAYPQDITSDKTPESCL